MKAEEQYLALCKELFHKGVWLDNERTGKSCLTLPTKVLTYTPDDFPVLQSKQGLWKVAIREMVGYLNGYTSAEDFRNLGTKTWDCNANETEAWLQNPNRKGKDDMGKCYGAVARDFGGINLIQKVINNLRNGIDDRGEIITFWKPDDFDKGCLRPCMHSHQFIKIGGTLHLTSSQRSGDVPLGVPFNMIQCWWLLNFMCSITGLRQGNNTHIINHPHIYENQLKGMITQLQQSESDKYNYLKMNKVSYQPTEYTYEDGVVGVREKYSPLEGILIDYHHCGAIKFPFSK